MQEDLNSKNLDIRAFGFYCGKHRKLVAELLRLQSLVALSVLLQHRFL